MLSSYSAFKQKPALELFFGSIFTILYIMLFLKYGELILGLLPLAAVWMNILFRWQRGIYLLLIYLPFAGVVTLLLYPSPLPTLFKDIFFVMPAYVSFCLFWVLKRPNVNIYIPKFIIASLSGLAVLVFVQMFNPSVANWLVAAIGAKVWLFYIPLMILASTLINYKEDIIKIFRIMVIIAWIPCTIGIIQWIGSMIIGYQVTMQAFYGDAAAGATQNFASFNIGGTFYRIPSTFTFVAQYFGYTLAMVVPAFALMRMDPSRKWRRFSKLTLGFVIIASFLSGARAAYVFIPLLIMLIYLLEGKVKGLIWAMILIPVLLTVALGISGIDIGNLSDLMWTLFTHYADTIAYTGLVQSISQAPLGLGTGMNTGPARYAFADPNSFVAFENYYAKAVYELGIPGLVIVGLLFMLLIVYGYKAHQRIHDKKLRACSSALLAFIITMAINSFKGWQIDLDPINVYFWIFSGILLKLPYLKTVSDQPDEILKSINLNKG